jgi:hypothetical protein
MTNDSERLPYGLVTRGIGPGIEGRAELARPLYHKAARHASVVSEKLPCLAPIADECLIFRPLTTEYTASRSPNAIMELLQREAVSIIDLLRQPVYP